VRTDVRGRVSFASRRAWGKDARGELMREAAALPLDYPEASVVEEDSLHAQTWH